MRSAWAPRGWPGCCTSRRWRSRRCRWCRPCIASGVIILALLGRFLLGWSISRRQWHGIVLTAGALSVLVLTLPAPSAHAMAGPGKLLFVIAMLGVGTMLVLAPRLGIPAHSYGAMLGATAGTLLGVSDVANKALFQVAAGGPVAMISSPWLSLTVLAGVSAFVVSGLVRWQHHGDARRDSRLRRQLVERCAAGRPTGLGIRTDRGRRFSHGVGAWPCRGRNFGRDRVS